MDLDSIATRTTSHNSLRSAYNGKTPSQGHIRQSNTAQGLSRPSSQRTPLRAVDNNAMLLKSPGPLESMLKTTTETGDIGLFTIKADSSPAAYHHRPRPGPILQDVPFARSTRTRYHPERGHFQDDRLRLPSSYRDTTSEILSLYGSEAQQSRTFTPSNEDAQRSYSLTTCSSRHIPSQRSTATLQSLSSTSALQRPRSPFPYPTRLKRPGARPASPAVTDNGAIDYSRMVELDRSYQRPVQGGHRQPQTYGSRRAPFSLRSEANRSTTSLPSRSSPGPYHMSPSPYRSRTPTSYCSRTPRPSDRSRIGPNEQGLRSPSLTSIVEMYQRPATSNSNVPPLCSTGSFYYDYSEEFENSPSPWVEPEIPLCPVPQRAPSLSRPMVLRAEEKGSLDEIDDGKEGGKDLNSIVPIPEEGPLDEPATVSKQHTKASPESTSSGQHTTIKEPANSHSESATSKIDDEGVTQLVVKARCHTAEDEHVHSPMTQFAPMDAEQRAVHPAKINSTQVLANIKSRHRFSSFDNSALGTNVLLPSKRCRRSNTVGARTGQINHEAVKKDRSHSSMRKLRNTLHPNLFEFASSLTSFDRLTKSPLSKKGQSGASGEDTEQLIGRMSQSLDGSSLHGDTKIVGEALSSQQSSEDADSGRPFYKRHRRNRAATRISTTNITKSISDRNVLQDCGMVLATALSRSPSPTQQLKVKKIIPQLMKALPPLPAEAEIYDHDGCPVKKRTLSTSTLDKHEETEGNYDHGTGQPGASPQKLRLRVKPLPSTPVPVGDVFDIAQSEKLSVSNESESPVQRRLKIKIARTPAVPAHTGKDGTVLRSPALKQCNSLADLEHCARKDMFTSQCLLKNAFSMGDNIARSDRKDAAPASHLDMMDAEGCATDEDPQVSPPSAGRELRRARSMVLGTDQGELHGLRQKLSFLRLRLGPHQGARVAKNEETVFPFGIRGGPGSSSAMSPDGELKKVQPKIAELRSGKAKRRVRRWAKGAKNAMRRAMRKTLDRSAGSTA